VAPSGATGGYRIVHFGRRWSGAASLGGEVVLAADEVGLGQPGAYVGVDVLRAGQAKGV
jgi:hypothetical protein